MFLTNYYISSIILISYFSYIAIEVFKKKINTKKAILIFIILILIFIITVVYIFYANFTRSAIDYLVMAVAFQIVFKQKLVKCLAVSFTAFAYLFIAEILFCLILVITLGVDSVELSRHWSGGILSNLTISFIAIFLFQFEHPRVFFEKLINTSERTQYNEIFVLFMFIMGALTNKNSLILGKNWQYVINLILIFLFGVIIFYLFKEKQNSKQLSLKYDQLFNCIQRFERELSEKNMTIHEYNNQLISLRGFIEEDRKKAHNYLTSIINGLKNSNSSLLNDMDNLPKGGFKGLLYYKLGDLAQDKIHVFTNISDSVKKSVFSKLDVDFYRDIVKIIGVLLDNAIEAAKVSEKKQIVLEIYQKGDEFNFILSNTYTGELKIELFHNMGYSTKGKGRGYGLSLVDQIINQYTNIKKTCEAINDYYIVHLSINLKSIPTEK